MKKAGLKPAFLLLSFMLQRTNLICSSSLQGQKRFC
jgi:hypothetical protein